LIATSTSIAVILVRLQLIIRSVGTRRDFTSFLFTVRSSDPNRALSKFISLNNIVISITGSAFVVEYIVALAGRHTKHSRWIGGTSDCGSRWELPTLGRSRIVRVSGKDRDEKGDNQQ